MTHRDAILQSIRRSLSTGYLPAALPTPPEPAPLTPPPPMEAQVADFRQNLEAVRGRVHGPLSPQPATETVVRLLLEAGAGDVLGWPLADVGLPGLGAALSLAGIHLVPTHVPDQAPGRTAILQSLATVPVGLTGAQAGLADTGSLLLVHGPDRSRLASLLPPVHIVVLFLKDLRHDLATLLAERPDLLDTSSNVVFVTGPSRTADIELTPVFGVHGPKRLEVVLVAD